MILLDTNILIEVLKGNQTVIDWLRPDQAYCISVVCVMELVYGAKDKQETITIQEALKPLNCYHISSKISKRALELMQKYSKSHNLSIPDALIAATSLEEDHCLLTLNQKDFRYIEGLRLAEIK